MGSGLVIASPNGVARMSRIWLYTYLKSFYNDKSRPFGTNNLLKPGVAMPNVLEPFIGEMALEQNSKVVLKPYL